MKENLKKNWWLFLVKGIVAVIFGLLIIFNPLVLILTFLSVFGIFLIFSGIILITLAFLGETENKIIRSLEGLLFIFTGILILFNPVGAAGGLMFIIAVWAIASGFLQIVSAIRLRKLIDNDVMMFISGAVSVVFGIVLATNLIEGAEIITMFFGFFALVTGILSIILSFKLKNLILISSMEK